MQFSYRNACIQAIARLKKRVPALDASDTGTLEDYDQRLKEEAEASRSHLTVKKASRLTMDRAAMLAQDFVVDLPPGKGGNIPTEEGGTKKCERCGTDFIVHGAMSEIEARACTHHWGRLETTCEDQAYFQCRKLSSRQPTRLADGAAVNTRSAGQAASKLDMSLSRSRQSNCIPELHLCLHQACSVRVAKRLSRLQLWTAKWSIRQPA